MRIGPFSIEAQENWTECDCPANLCSDSSNPRHPNGMRAYTVWIVWDFEHDEHASNRYPGFADFYEKRRDALADIDRFLLGKLERRTLI